MERNDEASMIWYGMDGMPPQRCEMHTSEPVALNFSHIDGRPVHPMVQRQGRQEAYAQQQAAGAEIHAKVRTFMHENPGATYVKAFANVIARNPELKKRYAGVQ